ncbi:MAG TPA: ABC transporter permease [Acidimicrobiales bacterium]|nr:ABC transporter permease [Acidimicrobiales bacterium]
MSERGAINGTARIADQGYRRYDGPRLGPDHAIRSVIAHTLRRILGLRRPARAKILPVVTIVFSYLPATVFVGVIALFGRFGAQDQARRVVPKYADYYGFILSAIVLFVTLVAPEALCPDRRSRLLSLYLASPLTRMTYLLSKATAVFAVLSMVTIGPPLLLLVGLALQNAGPDSFTGLLSVLGRIVLSGAMLAALFTALSTAIASLTDRRAVAAAGTLLLLVGTGIVAGTLHEGLGLSASVLVLSLTRAPFELVVRIYGEPSTVPSLTTAALVAGVAAWTILGAAVTVIRYQRLQVTR